MKKIGQVKLEKAMKKAMSNDGILNLAEKLGTTRQTLYNLKNGKSNLEEMSIGLCRTLNQILDIDYEDWFEYEGDNDSKEA